MRERLVSYLLGELSPQEAAELETQVESDPKLREQVEHLRDCLLLEETSDEPPTGLADRTADSVHDLVLGLESSTPTEPVATIDPPRRTSNFTLVDGIVAAGVVLAIGMMLFPALQESREASRRIACQDNLRQLGLALHGYSNRHAGLIPHVQPGENAGIYSVKLADGGFIDRDDLAKLVVCRASPLGEQIATGAVAIRIPHGKELSLASGPTLATLRKLMGGSYAYRLGYLDGPLYVPINTCRSSRSPILSDAPNPGVAGRWQSLNHGGYGQNVLFQDGSVSYRVNCLLPSNDDNFYVNQEGQPAAGRNWNDAVLVSSELTPGVLPAVEPTRVRGYVRIRAYSLPSRITPEVRLVPASAVR